MSPPASNSVSPSGSDTDIGVPGPSARQWVAPPFPVPAGIIPGLEYLLGASDLLIIPDVIQCCCPKFGVRIIQKDGKQLYTIAPPNGCCECKGCCACNKCPKYAEPPFEMKDQSGKIVATFKVLNKHCCYYGCNPCGPCQDRYNVEIHCFDANFNNLGFVKNYNYQCCERKCCCDDGTMMIHVQNQHGGIEVVASSTPKKCCGKLCDELKCKIPYNTWNFKAGEAPIGQLVQRELCDDNTCMKCYSHQPSWGLTFPADMDVSTKARMIGLVLMVHGFYAQKSQAHQVSQ